MIGADGHGGPFGGIEVGDEHRAGPGRLLLLGLLLLFLLGRRLHGRGDRERPVADRRPGRRAGDFARFLEFARGSLMETQNHLIDGRDRGYLDAALYSRLVHLCRAALKTTTALMREKQRQAAALKRKRPRQG